MTFLFIGLLLSSGSRATIAFRAASLQRFRAPASRTRLCGYLESLSTPVNNDRYPEPHTTSPSTIGARASFSTTTAGNFEQVPVLSLAQADAIVNAAIGVCKRNQFNPVTAMVLDAAGSILVSKRMDGCSPVGVSDFAHAKAYSCLVNKYPSRAFRDRYTAEPNQAAKFCQMTSMVAVSGNRMAPFPGGILLKVDDYVIGSVGVSGAAGDEDEYCAIQGVIESGVVGLATDPQQHACATVKD